MQLEEEEDVFEDEERHDVPGAGRRHQVVRVALQPPLAARRQREHELRDGAVVALARPLVQQKHARAEDIVGIFVCDFVAFVVRCLKLFAIGGQTRR